MKLSSIVLGEGQVHADWCNTCMRVSGKLISTVPNDSDLLWKIVTGNDLQSKRQSSMWNLSLLTAVTCRTSWWHTGWYYNQQGGAWLSVGGVKNVCGHSGYYSAWHHSSTSIACSTVVLPHLPLSWSFTVWSDFLHRWRTCWRAAAEMQMALRITL